MTCGSLFSGIGGFELGLLWSGLVDEVKWQVEIDDYCNKVLEKNFPDVKRYKDIRNVGKHNLESVDLICGGFPCQPFSVAGKRKGKEDDRYLWHEMFRVISELQPRLVIGENVSGIINLALDQVLSDLESQGYETTTFIIPACAVNAPHRRDRVWIIANLKSNGYESNYHGQRNKISKWLLDNDRQKTTTMGGTITSSYWDNRWTTVATEFCRVDDGIPHRVDRLKCLGNAVVPQVVCAIGTIIKEWIEDANRKTQ